MRIRGLLALALLLLPVCLHCKLCLVLLVENETASLERCLASAKDIIDCLVVCDSGSSEKTDSIIRHFLKETGIPGKIFRQPWKNAGYNRTFAAKMAQITLEELGFSTKESHLLVLEANMLLNVSPGFDKKELSADAYLLLEKFSHPSYYQYTVDLIRASLPWESVGLVHPYWSCKESRQSQKLFTLTVEEQQENERFKEKTARDIPVLAQAIQEDPNNGHSIFYLAQSYKALGQLDEAIKWYKTRITKSEEKDEVWFSKFMLGACYEDKREWESALFWYLEAYQTNPNRVASLRKVANHYRMIGQNDLAYIFARHGSRIPFAQDQILFDDSPLNQYVFDEELSIAAYYTRFKEEGYTAADDLILRRNVPWHIKEQTYKNILYYVKKLEPTRILPIQCELPLIEFPSEERYHPMNPSIQKTNAGYEVILRSVNYTQTGAKVFHTIDSSGIFKTRNFLLHYDRDFHLLSQQEIIENLERERIDCWISNNIHGLDDCRLFHFHNKRYFTCTTNDTNPTGNFQISLCELEEAHVTQLTPLFGPDPHRCEKNWVPFIKNEEIHLIYSYDPFLIYRPNTDTGECEVALQYTPTHDFSRFRGSSSPIAYENGYLILVHEVVHLPSYERCYLHRFLYLDKNFVVKSLSKPFTFLHQGVEFCCAMTMDHSGKELILSVGIEDREAYLFFVDLNTVKSELRPLPNL